MNNTIMVDSHLHTKLCKHAWGEIFDFTEAAIRFGLKEIVFADHMPFANNFDLSHRMAWNQMDTYLNWIEQARIRYPEIIIHTGIEADYYEGFEEYTYKFLNEFDFDAVIMSIHFLRHWPGGSWVYNYNIPDKSKLEIYKDYLATLIKGINTGLFDILGHVDVIRDTEDSFIQLMPEEIDNVLSALKRADMAIEINTSGFRKKVVSSYPGMDWFPAIKKKNLAITTGSDAHKPGHVAFKFNELYQQLDKVGIKKLVRFKKRVMQLIH
jgi:histidinol-phosphatase (PHP family)